MDWRERMMRHWGPGVLAGITLGDWWRLLRHGGVAVDFSCLPRAVAITVQSVKNSTIGLVERRRYRRLLQKVEIQPPVFILGHWRSGTTHLHQLLAQDTRLAAPNSYQVSFPHIFLSAEAWDSRLMSFFLPARRPMDNMEMRLTSPQEDEFALCASSLKSPCLSWVFPRQKQRFEKYLTFQTASPGEIEEWKNALVGFLKKVQWRHGRPLVLKSPPHTARVRLLLELFPDAKFVHIHRNPYRVFQSTRHSFLRLFEWHRLQRTDLADLDDWILRQYQEMYAAFFAQRSLIPAGRLHEIGFEELEKEPMPELRRLYQALALPDFEPCEPAIRAYVAAQSGYQKNRLPNLPGELRVRIAQAWGTCFEEWGYSRSGA